LIFTKKLGQFWLFDQVDEAIHDLTVSYDSVVFAVGDSGLIVTNVIPQTIGISEQYNSLFRVYPNPSSGIYKLEGAESAEVIIYNALGTEVLKIDSFKLNEEIDLSSQIDGVYFIHVKTAKTTEMIKVVKQH